MSATPFADLKALATHLRQELQTKKFILLYAYNGTGKTRLSTAFKDLGKKQVSSPLVTQAGESLVTQAREQFMVKAMEADTLYFNAFTEDLFSWDNDLANDRERVLKINRDSRFFAGLGELEMDNRIRPLLNRYADFDFKIDTTEWEVSFSREIQNGDKLETVDDIKISRGEENIFIWCFFLAIVQLALDGAEAYRWVKYIYIDDPISSLDEHNAIAVASHMVQLLTGADRQIETVISTHHTLFFNVVSNELREELRNRKASQHFLSRGSTSGSYLLRKQEGDTPFFHHVAALAQLYEADRSGQLFTHHFNMLRSVLETTASFHGYRDAADEDGVLHTRLINILSHGNYSLYEPQEMLEENKRYFRKILTEFISRYPFNPALFPQPPATAATVIPVKS
jgi:wobble nucleotide-excising tRNase